MVEGGAVPVPVPVPVPDGIGAKLLRGARDLVMLVISTKCPTTPAWCSGTETGTETGSHGRGTKEDRRR